MNKERRRRKGGFLTFFFFFPTPIGAAKLFFFHVIVTGMSRDIISAPATWIVITIMIMIVIKWRRKRVGATD